MKALEPAGLRVHGVMFDIWGEPITACWDVEEYDPLHPTDYGAHLAQGAAKRKREEAQRNRTRVVMERAAQILEGGGSTKVVELSKIDARTDTKRILRDAGWVEGIGIGKGIVSPLEFALAEGSRPRIRESENLSVKVYRVSSSRGLLDLDTEEPTAARSRIVSVLVWNPRVSDKVIEEGLISSFETFGNLRDVQTAACPESGREHSRFCLEFQERGEALAARRGAAIVLQRIGNLWDHARSSLFDENLYTSGRMFA